MKYMRTSRKSVKIGFYTVVQESPTMVSIYGNYGLTHITSRNEWKKTVKIAQLMQKAYSDGFKAAQEESEVWE